MHPYIEILNDYLSENPLASDCSAACSLLERIYCCHQQQRTEDTAQIRELFGQLDAVLKKLSIKEQDRVVDIACDLCGESARSSFCEGLLVGFRLYNELNSRGG